jgi:flagellar hook-length control protein FliK
MSGAFPIFAGHAQSQAQPAAKPAQSAQATHMSQGPAGNAAPSQASTQTSPQTSPADAKHTDKDSHDKDFPAVFKSLLQGDAAQSDKQPLTMDATQLLGAKKNDKSAVADAKEQTDDAAAAMAGLPMFAAQTGKGLPQIAWSGYAAVADNNGASALAMQGDQNNVISSKIVSGKDLPNAILQAQEQVAKAQLQQGTTPAGDGTNFSAALNKQNLPGLQLAHQFLADNASLPQAHTLDTAALSNSHNPMVGDLSAVAAAAATRGSDNVAQQISVAVQHPQWTQQLGDRVQWMVGQNLQQAEIHLNPPELGALQVHIQLHGDQANVSFSSPHAVVRDALDAAIPRLRDMMHHSGLTLGDVNVSGQALAQHQSRDPNPQQGQHARGHGRGVTDEPQAIVATTSLQHLSPKGMVDIYA